MRDLNSINPEMLRPSKFGGIGAGLLFLSTVFSIPLAYGAAPNVPFIENPIVLVLLAVLGISLFAIPLPIIFRWGWEARHYGFSLVCLAGLSFLALVPLASVLLYGKAPNVVKLFLLLFYGGVHYFWCRRFSLIYKEVFSDGRLRAMVYQEEADAIYYMRRGDDFLLKKHFRFSQMPRDRYIVLCIALGLLTIPVMGPVTDFFGVSFVHIFLLVGMIPISCMGVGIAFRALLIFYLYPSRIKRSTGKEVYVDIASMYQNVVQRRAAKKT